MLGLRSGGRCWLRLQPGSLLNHVLRKLLGCLICLLKFLKHLNLDVLEMVASQPVLKRSYFSLALLVLLKHLPLLGRHPVMVSFGGRNRSILCKCILLPNEALLERTELGLSVRFNSRFVS